MNESRNDPTLIVDTDQRPVDVIVFPGRSSTTETRSWAAVHRRFRGLVELGLLTLVIILALAVVRLASASRPAEPTGGASITTGSRTVPPGSAVPVTHPRMIAPETASPGEQIIVLVYAYRGGCGPTELRFDDMPVIHRLNRYLGSPHADWIEMFMILDVPTGAFRGRHEIQLFGPGTGRTGSRCGVKPTDRTLLATLAITLGP
jgi:hypothetical protein